MVQSQIDYCVVHRDWDSLLLEFVCWFFSSFSELWGCFALAYSMHDQHDLMVSWKPALFFSYDDIFISLSGDLGLETILKY